MLLWASFSLLTLVVTAALVWPLLARRVAPVEDTELERRLAVFRDRRDEIGRERAAGRLSAAEAEQAREDLLRQMAEELPPEALSGIDRPAHAPTGRRPSRAPLFAGLAVAIALPVLAIGVYRGVGSPELAIAQLEGRQFVADSPHAQFDALLAEIENRLRANPKDGEAWAVLAQTYKIVGNHGAAIEAFEQAVELLPEDARLLAEFAESTALAAGGDFSGRATALLERALAADPNDQKSVALMGAARYRAGDLPQAHRYLSQLLASLPPESGEAGQIRAIVEQIAAELGASGKQPEAASPGPSSPSVAAAPSPVAPAASAAVPGTSAAASQPALRGTVSVASKLAGRLPANATLFVIARAAQGPRVPVAVLRVPAARLPVDFELDDENAMDPSRPLSSVGAIAIEARLSVSGDAIRKPGDLYGEPVSVEQGSDGIAILIDRNVEP
ncbi:MAG TPA: c-type cytochrome biogenesis protein CcmI [Burkholderiaceae bacterium]|nr:c-type cytochrome biogenesis protein CcmI [Burkholderiaceae bacterium]